MSQNIQGTFTTGSTASTGGIASDPLVIDTGHTTLLLSISGATASNTVKTQKQTVPGGAWVDQTTYNSDQAAVSVAVAAGEQWRLITVAMQAIRDIRYSLALGAQTQVTGGFVAVSPAPDLGGTTQSLTGAETAATQALVSGAWNPVLNDVTAAAANVASANAAMVALSAAGGGKFDGARSGVAYVSGRLVVPANITADFGGLEIRLTGGTYSNLLVTSAYDRIDKGQMIALILTWSAGRAVSAVRSDGQPHGLAVGDYVAVTSANLAPSMFKGVFPVTSVTDANNFVFRLHRTPRTGPTGTANFTKADTNVTIIGGVWNQDYTKNLGGTGNSNTHCMILGAAAHIRAIRPRFKNVSKFCLQFGLVFDYGWDGVVADGTNSDIIKVYGPAVDVKGYGISGKNGDDVLSIQSREPAAYYADYMWTFAGDCHGGIVEGIHAKTVIGANLFVAYFSANEYWGDITIRGIDGEAGYGAVVSGIENNATLDTITFERCRPACTIDLYINDYNGVSTGVTVNSIKFLAAGYESIDHASNPRVAGIYGRSGVSVNNLTLDGVSLNDASWPGALFSFWGQLLGPIKVLNIQGGSFIGDGTTNASLLLLSSAPNVVNIDKVYASGLVSMLRVNTGSPQINITNSDLNVTGVVSTFAAANVYLAGNRINVGSNGVVRSNVAAAVTVRSGGNNWVAGAAITNGSAAATWSLYGFDLSVDAGLSGVAKTNGSYFMNTASGRGTLAQNRLVVGNGTVLSQLDTPANTY